MKCDYHVHTMYSDDSTVLMEDYVKKGIALGLDEICFCDHVDYGIKRDWDDPRGVLYDEKRSVGEQAIANVDYPKYVHDFVTLKEKYKDEITLKMGMEFGVQRHTIGQFQALFHRYSFDFIILSIHQVDDKEFWTQDFQKGKTQEKYQREYYQALLNVIKEYRDYSVLGHLDLIKRYDKCGAYPDEKIMDLVDEILKTVIHDNKGIEINTSSWQYSLLDTSPSKNILKRYLELGGKIITIGSDAHTTDRLADHQEEAKQILKEIGFKAFCTFENMKPTFHQL